MLEGVEEEFAGIAVNAFEGPPAAAVVPVSSHPSARQRSLKLLFIVPSRRLYLSLQRISAPLRKMIFEILCILSVIIGQMVNIGTGIHRIEVKFVRLRERG